MIVRCVSRRACFKAFAQRYRCVPAPWPTRFIGSQKRLAHLSTSTIPRDKEIPPDVKAHRYGIFDKLKYPDEDDFQKPSVWAALLERGLPFHLRLHRGAQDGQMIDATGLAEILIAAQRVFDERSIDREGVDLLFHLGVVEGRWDAVVWIVKRLVEAFGGGKGLHNTPHPEGIFPWSTKHPLQELTRSEVDLSQTVDFSNPSPTSSSPMSTLDELTADWTSEYEGNEKLQRTCLGQIWQSLGHMTMACVDGAMKPEILEIIAYLHHMEVMPTAIYNQKPSPDSTAIQQPPTLRLFSSRILTSLSDAAWRAHERVVVEEAKAQGAEYASLRPEIPGMAYRIRVAGLRPEIWMELILWSCLHGGWIEDGLKILRMLSLEKSDPQWRALSWRSLIPSRETEEQNWDEIDRLINTQGAPHETDLNVNTGRTISSEIINAYIDAALCIMPQVKGIPPSTTLRRLKRLKVLLDRSGLPLSTGSWDAILLRYFDQAPSVIHSRATFRQLINLSPVMGEEVRSGDSRNLPEYVMDGSAALLGLFHRALLSSIRAGDVDGALRLFKALQERADSNKHQSIVDFLRKQQATEQEDEQTPDALFTSYFSGIDYPAFDLQIPPTTLGPFLDLITDAKAYEFGSWMLYSYDLDGPVIPQRLYNDAALGPVLVRFAAETGDGQLLDKLIHGESLLAKPGQPTLPKHIIQSFFTSQVNLKRWDAAERIRQHMNQNSFLWNPIDLAHVVRIMLFELHNTDPKQGVSDFERAKSLFATMISDDNSESARRYDAQVSMLLTMLGTLDPNWAKFCIDLDCLRTFYYVDLPIKAFNLALEGIANAHGAQAARRALELFWPFRSRVGIRREKRKGQSSRQASSEGSEAPLTIHSRKRINIRSENAVQKVSIYGFLEPDLTTIRIILRRAIQEFRDEEAVKDSSSVASPLDSARNSRPAKTDFTASDTISWAAECLRSLKMSDEDVIAELRGSLHDYEIRALEAKMPSLFEQDERGEEVD